MVSTISIAGQDFTLEVLDNVFQPTSTTRKLADHLVIPPGAHVLDLGCGSGPLAIIAAMMGAGHVTAVDVMPAACELAQKNIERNGLKHKITVRCGNLFEPVAGQVFDMIIDDVSGVADRVARISPWFPSCIPTGGEDGTDLIIKVLDQARHYLRPGGWIYFPILSLSAGRKIVDSAQRFFAGTAECLASYSIPFCKEFYDAIEELDQLRQRGLIDFAKRGSRYTWTLEVWRAQLTPDAAATLSASA